MQAAPIEHIDDLVRAVAARMIDLMHEAEGVGLAAPQVGLPWRMFVTHAQDEAQPQVYINPHLQPVAGSPRVRHEEGCLSLPGIYVEVDRPAAVELTALDLEGNELRLSDDSTRARVWQHEFDHLNGVLIIDKMSPLDRLATRRALKDLQAAAAKDR